MHFCRTFGSVDLRAFLPRPADFHLRPAPRRFVLAPPRPAEIWSAPHIPGPQTKATAHPLQTLASQIQYLHHCTFTVASTYTLARTYTFAVLTSFICIRHCKYLYGCKYLHGSNYLHRCKYLHSCKYLLFCYIFLIN